MARGVLDFLSVGQGFYPRKSRDHLVSFDNCGRVFGALLKNLLELPKSFLDGGKRNAWRTSP